MWPRRWFSKLAGSDGGVGVARQSRLPGIADGLTSAVLDRVRDVVCIRDLDGTVLFVNSAASDVLGRSAAELNGTSLDVHLHPDDRLAALSAWQRLLAGETPQAREVRWQHPSGTLLSLEMTNSTLPVHNPQQAGPYIISVIRDISRQRSLNAALQHTRDELSGAVAAGSSLGETLRVKASSTVMLSE